MARKLQFIAILFFSFWHVELYGQDNVLLQRDVLDLEDIRSIEDVEGLKVVSGSRSSKDPADLPFTIYVITREEIIRNGYITLTDVMKRVPGIKVSQPGGAEEGELFLMRGFKGNQYTKILVNDIPIQPSTTGSFPIAAQLPIRQAERIEVIFGPASSIYGADATAGVINIITKGAKDGTFAHADAELGQFGYNYLNFTVGGKVGKSSSILEYAFYGSSSSTSDLNVVYDEDFLYHPLAVFQLSYPDSTFNINGTNYLPLEINDEVLKKEGVDPEDFKKELYQPFYEGTTSSPEFSSIPQSSRQLGVELKYKGWTFRYSDMYRKVHSSVAISTYHYSRSYPQVFLGEHIRRGTVSYDKSWEKISSTTNLSYLSLRQDNNSAHSVNYPNLDNSNIAYLYQASDDLFLEQYFTYQPTDKVELVMGATYQYSGNLPKTNELESPFDIKSYAPFSLERTRPHPVYGFFGYNPLRFSNAAGYVQLFYSVKKLRFMLGLRGDRDSRYGAKINPRIAFLYELTPNAKLYTSYGTSYRAPSSLLAYSSLVVPYDATNMKLSYQIVPNPDLKAETFSAVELGYRHNLNKNWSLNMSGYFNQIEDLIVPQVVSLDTVLYPNGTPGDTRTFLNSSSATSTLFGLQMTVKGKDIIPSVKLMTDLHISLSEGKEILPDGGTKISLFREMPGYIGQLNVSLFPTKNLYLNFTNTMTSSWLRSFIPDADQVNDPLYKIDGYYTLDFLGRYYISTNISSYVRVTNVFDKKYGGIAATGLDVDLIYNPQPGRNIQVGLSFNLE